MLKFEMKLSAYIIICNMISSLYKTKQLLRETIRREYAKC